ncbi:MAG: methyl-accepting chemotaxis protein [Pseudomonadota bacterium]
MSWQTMTIGRKITLGFGIVLILFTVVGLLSYTGVNTIVKNAGDVIYARNLDGVLAQKEVDHLNWVNQVNALLTDKTVTELHVETDHTKCGFGQWLYSDERKQAETVVPGLTTLFKSIETPHRNLHDSAIEIAGVFKQADPELPGLLQARTNDHLKWAASLNETFLLNKEAVTVNLDPETCALGKWLKSPQAEAIVKNASPEFKRIWDEMIQTHMALHNSAGEIAHNYKKVHKGLRHLLKDMLADHLQWAETVSSAIIAGDTSLKVATDPTQCRFGKLMASEEFKAVTASFPELKAIIESIQKPHQELHSSALEIAALLGPGHSMDQLRNVFAARTLPALNQVKSLIHQAIDLETGLNTAQSHALDIFQNTTMPLLNKTVASLGSLGSIAEADVKGMVQANTIFATKTKPNLHEVQGLLKEIRATAGKNVITDEAMLSAATGVKRNVTILGMAAIILGLGFAFLIVRSIVSVLSSVSQRMDEGANQVSAASTQVSAASQSLAQGSSEQAASIEETSSSLEEMSSMTHKNAENAGEADRLMKEANTIVVKANQSMEQVTRSMTEITQASEETSRIIKTIDEIAFQTNLLALNAAVEAARAGEAGAGFAVVADEVRNLAMRAAEAARSTSDLIEGTVKKVSQGNLLVSDTSEAFSEVAQSTAKVAQLLSEISAASSEQSTGIEQINLAVVEMDKVVQQNAATAEESASAAEELDAQAYQLKEAVTDLIQIVGGTARSLSEIHGPDQKTIGHHPGKSVRRLTVAHGHSRPGQTKHLSHSHAESVTPFDDKK